MWWTYIKMAVRLLLALVAQPGPTDRRTDLQILCGNYQLRFREVVISSRRARVIRVPPPEPDPEEEAQRLEFYGSQALALPVEDSGHPPS